MGKEWRVSTTLVVVVGVLVLSIILVAHPGTAAEATTKTVPFFTPPPNVFPPPYLGAILYAGVGPVLYAVEPQAAKPITTPLPLSPSSGAVIEALTVDPIGRTVYALVSDVAAAATPVLIEVAFNGYKMSVTGQAALPDVPVNVTKGAITYSAKYQGVIVRTQFDNTAYIVSVPSLTVSEFTALSISGHASGDIFAFDDQGHNESWVAPASVYTEVDTQTGGILFFDLITGTSHTTGKFQSPPTLTYYDAFSRFFWALGQGYIYYGPNVSTSTVDLEQTPFGPDVEPLRFVAYGSYISPGMSTVWVSYSDGTLRSFLIDNGNITEVVKEDISLCKALAFQTSTRDIQPYHLPGLPTAIVDFGDTPELLTEFYSPEGVVEKIWPVFNNFYYRGGTLFAPQIWNKETAQFLGGSGMTPNMITVNNTGGVPIYTYYNAWSAPITPTILGSLSTLYNPLSQLHVSSRERKLNYDLSPGSVKFSATLQGDLDESVFHHNTSEVLAWSFCIYDDQRLGAFDYVNYQTTKTPAVTTYTFFRPNGIALALNIPSQFLADGNVKFSPHTLSPPPGVDDQGNLRVCVQYHFPYFARTFYYDPDIAILVTPDNGSGDGSVDQKALQIAIPVAIGGFFFLCCAFIVVVVVVMTIVRRRQASEVVRRLTAGSITLPTPGSSERMFINDTGSEGAQQQQPQQQQEV
eukprot:TRINITY_DN3600_c0_g2_i1.p1 TRINITY_DN3600_c0_g2~~TRINITY_DN3600_c0_g2_i1.p1  ORF type:complete len:692 (-),score=86.33 TRINITY_DN3600_c0_g2_i1:63-2138(-)